MKEILLDKLKCFQDNKFIFDPIKHKYTYQDNEFISVTTYIQQFHKPFDTHYHSLRIAQRKGIPQEWVLNEWKEINDYANLIGLETHNWIEGYFRQIWTPLPTNQDIIHRINKFNKIYATHLYKLEPLAFEVKVFSKKWRIAGMIDALFIYRGQIFIIDYKTNKEFITDNNIKYPERLRYPFDSYYKTHLNEYSIQISLYALILKEWGINVAGGYLVYIGPDDNDAQMFKCENMTLLLEEYLNSERNFL
jgi:ATP-dependent exoDNAse (exonuclease V) beta subunit